VNEYLNLLKTVVDLGGSAVIATIMIVCVYKLLDRFAVAFMGNMEKIATSIGNQAQSMKEMSASINHMITKDNTEHREILLGMQVVGEELKSLVCEVRGLRGERGE